MKKVDNVVLWGYYGRNYGDNIMFFQIMDYLTALPRLRKVYVISESPYLKEMCGKYPQCEIITMDYSGRIQRDAWLKRLPGNSLHVWGGGTIFTDEEGDGNFYPFMFLKAHGFRYCYLSSGIGSLNKPIRIIKTKLLLRFSSLTAFREELSYQKALRITKSNTIKCTDDMVLEFAALCRDRMAKYQSKISDAEKYVLFSWRNLEHFMSMEKQIQIIDSFVSCLGDLSQKLNIPRIIALPLDTATDIQITEDVCQKMSDAGLHVEMLVESGVEAVTKIIANASFFFSGRLHSSMVAEIMGIPTFTLSYSPKIEYFYKSIGKRNFVNVLSNNIPPVDVVLHEASEHINLEVLTERVQNAKGNLQLLSKLIED